MKPPQLVDSALATRRVTDVDDILVGADAWAIHPEVAHLLFNLVRMAEATRVLEFGSGRSSQVLAAALPAQRGTLTSVEHEPEFSAEAWRAVENHSAVDAQLVKAPLALRASRHGIFYEYTGIQRALAARGPFDFVFIDGPPGHYGRDATLWAAAPHLVPGAFVLVDDAARPAEETAVRRWQRTLQLDAVCRPEIGRGVALLQLWGSGQRISLRTVLGSLHDRWQSLFRTAQL